MQGGGGGGGVSIGRRRHKPVMEELFANDVNPTRLHIDSCASEVRQRRHSTPHNSLAPPSLSRSLIGRARDLVGGSTVRGTIDEGESMNGGDDLRLFRHTSTENGRGVITVNGDGGRRSLGDCQYIPSNSPMRDM